MYCINRGCHPQSAYERRLGRRWWECGRNGLCALSFVSNVSSGLPVEHIVGNRCFGASRSAATSSTLDWKEPVSSNSSRRERNSCRLVDGTRMLKLACGGCCDGVVDLCIAL